MEPDLQTVSDRFNGGIHFSQHLVFALVEQAIARHDFEKLSEQAPKFHEIAVDGAFSFQRSPDEHIELPISFLRPIKIDSRSFGR